MVQYPRSSLVFSWFDNLEASDLIFKSVLKLSGSRRVPLSIFSSSRREMSTFHISEHLGHSRCFLKSDCVLSQYGQDILWENSMFHLVSGGNWSLRIPSRVKYWLPMGFPRCPDWDINNLFWFILCVDINSPTFLAFFLILLINKNLRFKEQL